MFSPAQLVADPLGVGSRFAIRTHAHVVAALKDKTGAVTGHGSQHMTHFEQVDGHARILTARFDDGADEPHTCDVVILAHSGAADAHSASVYWLPWNGNHSIRTMLTPSKHTVGGADPDIFLTADLDGCMVSVEGREDRPTVYHTNVGMNYGGSPANDPGMSDAAASTDMRRKRYKMYRYGYRRFSRTAALNKRDAGHGHKHKPGHATQLHYQVLRGRPSAASAEAAARWYAGQRLGLRPYQLAGVGSKHVVELTAAGGSVFGVRQHHRWRFFFQKLIRYDYFYDNHFRASDWLVMDCQEFWPGHGYGLHL